MVTKRDKEDGLGVLSDFKGVVSGSNGSGGVGVGEWCWLGRSRERLGKKGLIGSNWVIRLS